jgi:hypothetical protein
MSGILDLFIPKEKKFLDYLSLQVDILSQSVQKLSTLSTPKTYTPSTITKVLTYIQKKFF